MNRAYFSLAVLCLIALSGSVLGNPATELNKVIAQLDKFRSDDYSKEAAALIGEIKTKVLDGTDAYFSATQSVHDLCGLAIGSLDTYKNLLTGKTDQEKFTAQRTLLLKVLDDGIAKMTAGQNELMESSMSFNDAAGKLTQFNHQLKADFDKHSEYYQSKISQIRATAYGSAAPFLFLGLAIAAGIVEGKLVPELNEKMASIEKYYQDATVDFYNSFDDTKDKLKQEIQQINDLKVKAEETKIYVQLDDKAELKETILDSVSGLINKCKEYNAKHNGAK